MDKQYFIKTLNERLEAFANFRPDDTLPLSSVNALLGQIIQDAEKLNTELPATETEDEVLTHIRVLTTRLESPELILISNEMNSKLQAGNITAPIPLEPTDILDHVKVQPHGMVFSIVDAVVAYRRKTDLGLYESKTVVEKYASQNRDMLNKMLSEKWDTKVELAFVRF